MKLKQSVIAFTLILLLVLILGSESGENGLDRAAGQLEEALRESEVCAAVFGLNEPEVFV